MGKGDKRGKRKMAVVARIGKELIRAFRSVRGYGGSNRQNSVGGRTLNPLKIWLGFVLSKNRT